MQQIRWTLMKLHWVKKSQSQKIYTSWFHLYLWNNIIIEMEKKLVVASS